MLFEKMCVSDLLLWRVEVVYRCIAFAEFLVKLRVVKKKLSLSLVELVKGE